MNPENHGFGAPAKGYGLIGSNGFASYPEICQFLKSGANSVNDYDTRTPYAFMSSEWVSFDDVQSLSSKVKLSLS